VSEHARIDEAVAAATAAAAGLTGADAKSKAAHAGLLYDHGLAWVNFPPGAGGLGVSASLQDYADAAVDAAGLHRPDRHDNAIGFGMAAPTIAGYGTDEQKTWLKRIYTLETIVCQLFSEPGAGSDLAAVATKAVLDGDTYRVTGQKVWTSGAHNADLAILIARTDPSVPKHRGLSYFLLDMHAPGVETCGLRQITGEAEFNEVFLTDVPVPASMRLGEPGEGWKIANTTLNNERVAIGG